MFSYRHAFHAGNHADVLKHSVWIAMLQHLVEKDTALHVIDTHSGCGLYRLDGDYAQTSGEAAHGIKKLFDAAHQMRVHAAALKKIKTTVQKPATNKIVLTSTAKISQKPPTAPSIMALAPMLESYLDMVAQFNKTGSLRVYPGSPFIAQMLLREHDKLKLFEIHPVDSRTLEANIAQLEASRKIAVLNKDGFDSVRQFLPPISRRALLLCDPSYEIKSDYSRVVEMVMEAMRRFATGTYAVWYPIIPRPEAHDLPKRLKTLASRTSKPWLHATLTVKSSKLITDKQGDVQRPGLPASGVFIVNPPYTLKPALALALPQLVTLLGQDQHANFTLESGG